MYPAGSANQLPIRNGFAHDPCTKMIHFDFRPPLLLPAPNLCAKRVGLCLPGMTDPPRPGTLDGLTPWCPVSPVHGSSTHHRARPRFSITTSPLNPSRPRIRAPARQDEISHTTEPNHDVSCSQSQQDLEGSGSLLLIFLSGSRKPPK